MTQENNHPEGSDNLLVSYTIIRRTLGGLGTTLPFILAIFGYILYEPVIQGSMSQYYHTPMRDLLVGVLCAEAMFLFAYKGYGTHKDEKGPMLWLTDRTAGIIAAIAALGIAFFPTYNAQPLGQIPGGEFGDVAHWINNFGFRDWVRSWGLVDPGSVPQLTRFLHGLSALIFFAMLVVFCLVLFVRSGGKEPQGLKKERNKIYRLCGGLMIATMVTAIVISTFAPNTENYDLVFWVEAVSIFFFGVAWVVKGNAIDRWL